MPEANKRYGKSLPETIDPPERVCFVIEIPDTLQYRAALMGQLEWLADWRCWEHTQEDFYNPPARNVEAAQLFAIAVTEGCFVACPMTCEEMIACLQPLFDAQTAQITNLQQQITDLSQQLEDSQSVQTPEPVSVNDCNPAKVYSGSLGAVAQVELLINGVYKRAEVEAPDNFAEATELLLSAIPIFETLPMDELYSLVQWTFDNQRALFEASMVEEIEGHYWFEHAASQLYCLVKDDCIINHERIGMWLSSLVDIYPENYAAEIFSKFGNATEPAMANQIGELLNTLRGGQSLAEFFDDIIVQFGVGSEDENPDYLWIECAGGWTSHLDTTADDYGFGVVQGSWEEGVGFKDVFLNAGTGYRGFNIGMALSIPANVTSCTLTFEYTAGLMNPATGDFTAAVYDEEGQFTIELMTPNLPVSPLTGTNPVIYNSINIQLLCGIGYVPGVDPGGIAVLTAIDLQGTGIKPPEFP